MPKCALLRHGNMIVGLTMNSSTPRQYSPEYAALLEQGIARFAQERLGASVYKTFMTCIREKIAADLKSGHPLPSLPTASDPSGETRVDDKHSPGYALLLEESVARCVQGKLSASAFETCMARIREKIAEDVESGRPLPALPTSNP